MKRDTFLNPHERLSSLNGSTIREVLSLQLLVRLDLIVSSFTELRNWEMVESTRSAGYCRLPTDIFSEHSLNKYFQEKSSWFARFSIVFVSALLYRSQHDFDHAEEGLNSLVWRRILFWSEYRSLIIPYQKGQCVVCWHFHAWWSEWTSVWCWEFPETSRPRIRLEWLLTYHRFILYKRVTFVLYVGNCPQ